MLLVWEPVEKRRLMDAQGHAEPWGGLATKNLPAQCGFRPPEGVLTPWEGRCSSSE